MKVIKQYKVVFNGGSTQWFDSESEALSSRWFKEDGATIVTRHYVDETLADYEAMRRQGAKVVRCSHHEVLAMCREALKRGSAFAAAHIGPTTYKVMEIAKR